MWRAYEVIFRLRSPLHIGWGKVGSLQRTRPYVTGRALWGALTARLTRNAATGPGPATDSAQYRRVGDQVNQSMAFTYFYPATQVGDDYRVFWPWRDEGAFRRQLLSSYQGTALSTQQAAATGMLHEVEFIAPRTLDAGDPVFVVGYVFDQDDRAVPWQDALQTIQVGGERGYGWGDVRVVRIQETAATHLFGEKVVFDVGAGRPVVRLKATGELLAHTVARNVPAGGPVEPVVGREWRSDRQRNRHAGQHVEFVGVCYSPGSVVERDVDLVVGEYGIWRYSDPGGG